MRAARAGAAMRTSAARISAPAARTAPRRTLGSPSGEPGTLFGESAGDAMQGWEPIVYSCYGACTVLLVVGLANKPTTSINSWAKEEAAVRLKLKAAGEEIEFGTHYANSADGQYKDGKFQATAQYTKEGVGIAPVRVDDDEE